MNHCSLAAGTSTHQKGIAMKAILAAIIAASLSVGCSVLEGEQVASDTGGGGTVSPQRNVSNPSTKFINCDYGSQSQTESAAKSSLSDYSNWSRNLSSCDDFSWVSATETDSSGNVYLFGRETKYNFYNGSSTNLMKLKKMASDGRELWSQEITNSVTYSSPYDSGYSLEESYITLDNSGNVYLKSRFSIYDENNTSVTKNILKKYSSLGVEQWSVDLPDNTSDSYYGPQERQVFIDNIGRVFVTSSSQYYDDNTSSHVYKTVIEQYSSSGQEQWTKEFIRDNTYYDGDWLTFDSSGNFYRKNREEYFDSDNNSMGYQIVLNQYNSSGDQQWSDVISNQDSYYCCGSGGILIVDNSNNIYVTGRESYYDQYGSMTSSKDVLRKYSNTGLKLWTKDLSNSGSYYNGQVMVDNSGNVYLIDSMSYHDQYGSLIESKDILHKYNVSGVELWSQEIPLETVYDTCCGSYRNITLDNSGNVYVTNEERAYFDNGTLSDYSKNLTKFSSSGAEQWSHEILEDFSVGTIVNTTDHIWSHLIFDKNNNVYIEAGFHGHDENGDWINRSFLAKHNASGVEQWSYENSDVSFDRIFSSNNGNVYILDELRDVNTDGYTEYQQTLLLHLQ